jgi:uncharacterized tellurite resistance protein B-like protein
MTNEDIIESVISVLAVDGDVNKWEMQFFNDVCNRLDVSREAKKVVLTKAKQGKGRIHLPTNEADKKRLLYFLVQAVVADGKVVPEEHKILDAVVDKMGISKANVEKFLQMRLKEVKTETYTGQSKSSIVCPKCGNEQTTAYRCKRCGIIFKKYKQVQQPSDQEPDDIDKLKEILSSSNVIKGETS